jgi:hypothetical protein
LVIGHAIALKNELKCGFGNGKAALTRSTRTESTNPSQIEGDSRLPAG